MINNSLKFTLLLITSLTIGCGKKRVQDVKHEVTHTPEQQASTYLDSGDAYRPKSIATIDVSKLKKLLSGKPPQKKILQALKMAQVAVKDQKNFTEGSAKFQQIVYYYNLGILSLLRTIKGRKSKVIDQIIKFYHSKIFFGCGTFTEKCRNWSVFKSDPLTSLVLAEISFRYEPDNNHLFTLAQSYDIMHMAHGMANHGFDSNELKLVYLKHLKKYKDTLKGKSHKEQLSLARKVQIRTLKNLKDKELSPKVKEKLARIVLSTSPCEYSRVENQSELKGDLIFGLFKTVFSKNSKEIKKCIADANKLIQNRPDYMGPSFTQAFNKNLKDHTPILKSLNLIDEGKKLLSNAQAFFLVDRIYRGHLNTNESAEFLKILNVTSDQMLQATKTYVRIEIARMMIKTNQLMTDFYMNNGIANATQFTLALSESNIVGTEWQGITSIKMKSLHTFVRRHYMKSSNPKEFEKLENIFNSLNTNIQFLSIVPNMMHLALQVSKYQYPAEGPSGTIYKPEDVIKSLFDGKITNWFDFGGQKVPLKRVENLMSFYYALASNTFEMNKSSDTVGTQRYKGTIDFFKRSVNEYLQKYTATRRRDYIEIKNLYQGNKQIRSFINICQASRTNGIPNVGINLSFGDLRKYTYLGLAHSSSSFSDVKKVFSNAIVYGTLGAMIHDGRKSKSFVKGMLIMLVDFLKSRGETSEVEKILQIAQGPLNKINAIEKAITDTTLKMSQTIGSCYTELKWLERKQQNQLILRELEHLRKIHGLMTRLENNEMSKKEVNDTLLALNNFENSPINPSDNSLKYLDDIRNGIYRYSEFNLVSRIKESLKTINPNISVSYPGNFTERSTIYTDAEKQTIPIRYNKDFNVFATEALKVFNGSGQSFIHWIGPKNLLADLEDKLKTNSYLYLLTKGKGLSPNDLFDEMTEIAAFFNVNPEEAKILNLIGRTSRYIKTDHFRFFVDLSTNEQLRLTDRVFEYLVKPQNTSNIDTELMGIAQGFYINIVEGSVFNLFPLPVETLQKVGHLHGKLYGDIVAPVSQFVTAIKAAERSGQFQGEIPLETSSGSGFAINLSGGTRGSTLLNPSKESQFNTIVENFKERTKNYFGSTILWEH